ncbi:Uncharacterised protein [Mycobacteroides abscessus subsp. abscessus]|nr:Uncharacterised protein [Mycobacteroides abscessus subsp. abscessus]
MRVIDCLLKLVLRACATSGEEFLERVDVGLCQWLSGPQLLERKIVGLSSQVVAHLGVESLLVGTSRHVRHVDLGDVAGEGVLQIGVDDRLLCLLE